MRIFTYPETIELVRNELLKIPMGLLIHWCQAHHLSLVAILNVKESRTNVNTPELLFELLTLLGYQVALVRCSMYKGTAGNQITQYIIY